MINKEEVIKLKEHQPLLRVYDTKISGIFVLSASFNVKSKKFQALMPNKSSSTDFENTFKIEIHINKDGYPIKTFNTDNKISGWKNNIEDKYWHVNPDNSLCLGVEKDIQELFIKLPYAEFINHLLAGYFYYMSYMNYNHKEPWVAYRHDIYYWLDEPNMWTENLLKNYLFDIWIILQNINGLIKIQNKDNCPFCNIEINNKTNTKKSYKCKEHKIRIKNYNFFISVIKKIETNFKKPHSNFMSVA